MKPVGIFSLLNSGKVNRWIVYQREAGCFLANRYRIRQVGLEAVSNAVVIHPKQQGVIALVVKNQLCKTVPDYLTFCYD
ncbi:MAG: hypothetical protein JWP57_767 [Spirosoma sp.]|nr:hypothetical protein [Spirosoma sp.]